MSYTAIIAKLHEVSKALGWVEKGGRNEAQSYDYVRASDLFARVRKEFNERGIVFGLDITDVDHIVKEKVVLTTVRGTASFTDIASGETWTSGAVGSGSDTQAKGTAQAITGLLKSLLAAQFLLPTGDDPEATDETGQSTSKPAVRTNGPTPPPATRAGSDRLTPAQIVKLKASLGDAGLKTDDQKREFTKAVLSSPVGSKQMTPAQMDQILAAISEQPLVLEAARAFG